MKVTGKLSLIYIIPYTFELQFLIISKAHDSKANTVGIEILHIILILPIHFNVLHKINVLNVLMCPTKIKLKVQCANA